MEKLGKKVGKAFGEILNPYGPEWKVSWSDGKVELISHPVKNLALSLQPAQELIVDSKLMQCTHYDSRGCHLVPSADYDAAADVPTNKRTRSSSRRPPPAPPKKKSNKESDATASQNQTKKKPNKSAKNKAGKKPNKESDVTASQNQTKKKPNKSAKTKATTKETNDTDVSAHRPLPDAQALEVAATCALTARAKKGETLDEGHLRIGAGMAAVVQLEEVRKGQEKKWRRCRAKKLTNSQRSVLSKTFADGNYQFSILFAERSLQEYAMMQKSPLHINARNVFAAAIGQVMCQVVPASDKPLGGSVTNVFESLFPICELVRSKEINVVSYDIYHC